MFKFLKSCLNEKEKKMFDMMIKPYIIYSMINTVFVVMANKNVGILNEDVSYGLFVSWVIFSFVLLYTIAFRIISD